MGDVMGIGKSINVFLIDGSPNGLIKCTMGNWNGVAYKIPRIDLDKYKDRDHLKQTGVYFLFGKNEDDDSDLVYIGQAKERKNGEGILFRLQEHIRNPDKYYWTEAITFTNTDNSLGPTEVYYLEHKFCTIAKNTKRYTVKNGNDPNPGKPTEEKECELEEFIEYAKLVMAVLGHKVFVPKSEKISGTEEQLFYIERKSDKEKKAIGKLTSEGFLLLANSYITNNTSESMNSGYKILREKYTSRIKNDILKEDILFTSPSSASSFVLGRNSDGRTDWKTADGKSLKEVENEKANH
jgi:hypothetical protein